MVKVKHPFSVRGVCCGVCNQNFYQALIYLNKKNFWIQSHVLKEMTASQGSASITAKQVTTSFKITVNKLSRGEIYVANFINPENAASLSSF